MAKRSDKMGMWLIGACGGVGATVALGLAALKARRVGSTGLVTELPAFEGVGLVDPRSIVVGGHEVRAESLLDAVRGLGRRAGLFDEALIRTCTPALRAMQKNIRPGTLWGASPTIRAWANTNRSDRPGEKAGIARAKARGVSQSVGSSSLRTAEHTPMAAVERLAHDLRAFRARHRLDVVVVINLASSEPAARLGAAAKRYDSLRAALDQSGSQAVRKRSSGPDRPHHTIVPTSSLYALAAIEAECAYVNFTPSTGIDVRGIRERADELGLPYMGRDGKTGETLVKSVLAPMFAMRHLNVLSWVGENILGNRDGAVLNDPRTRQAKIRSKDRTVASIVGGRPATHVSIDYVPSLDDWKVAWDFIHFEGFLGTKMSMQFTWQGSDSILAAPLVIDLARLAALEVRRGSHGPMRHLGFFFKDPMGVKEHDLFTQWQHLVAHVCGVDR
jgi:myo-inositol-1-phosphate synthase